jgi:hypothetical protein
MPVESHPDQLEPENQDAVIWRFMNFRKFSDMTETGELYFCRADLFPSDENEGLPPDEYLRLLGLNGLDLRDRRELDDWIGCAAQFHEAFYVNCWHLFREESCAMWKQYGDGGVAICSKYRLLKSALDAMSDRAFLGLVRYGSGHLINRNWNVLRLITTKRARYADEREVRAVLWIPDPYAGINRHIDPDNRVHTRPLTPPPDRVSRGHRRSVDLQTLVTEIVVTPWASSTTLDEIKELVRKHRYTIPVQPSALTRYREFLPSGD